MLLPVLLLVFLPVLMVLLPVPLLVLLLVLLLPPQAAVTNIPIPRQRTSARM